MNFGTKIRTAIAIIAVINQALVTIGPVDFGNEASNLVYKWISLIFLVGAIASSHWYNNDFTPIAAEKTGEMRQEKAALKGAEFNGVAFEDGEEVAGVEECDEDE